MIGRCVEVRSTNGIVYSGMVIGIRDSGELGELFELGLSEKADYQRLVYVTDRRVQIRTLDDDA